MLSTDAFTLHYVWIGHQVRVRTVGVCTFARQVPALLQIQERLRRKGPVENSLRFC